MPLATGALPTGLRSAQLLHWRARDLSTRAASGQAGTLTRASALTITDSDNGALRVVSYQQPAFAPVDTDGDTIRESMSLLLGNTAEAFWLSYEAVPQAMTAYSKFVPVNVGAGGVILWQIGDSASTAPYLNVKSSTANNLIGHHQFAGGTAVDTTALTVTIGALTEIRLVFNSNGSILLGISTNGGAETVTATTTAPGLPAAWFDTKIWFGSINATAVMPMNLLAHKIAPGVQTMQQMRDSF